MKHLKESDIKYLAGLMDADGCLSLTKGKYYQLSLTASISIDKDGKYLKWLHKAVPNSKLYYKEFPDENWSPQYTFKVYDRKTLGMLLPRLLKHMNIKAIYWQKLWLKDPTALRSECGSLKPKNYPTTSWLAGFLDGDGHYRMANNNGYGKQLRIQVTLHRDDRSVLYWMSDKLGGSVREDKRGYFIWDRNLGARDKDFAIPFLKKIVRQSRLKKWKIEQMLNYHSQRLSNKSPKG